MLKPCCQAWVRRVSSTTTASDIIQAGDRVLLQIKGKDPFLSKVLRPDGSTSLQNGIVMHKDIIGRRTRDTVRTNRGEEIRVYYPPLADYVTLTPRIVTPIYPKDANLIVSLLDLHASPSATTRGPPSLEILEAGTGHGALTLYLAKAIHAANAARLNDDDGSIPHDGIVKDPAATVAEDWQGSKAMDVRKVKAELEASPEKRYYYFEDRRQAVIHTIDVSPKHSKHAKKIVNGFRQGMYAKDIEFHVGDVSQWIDQQVVNRGLDPKKQPYLSHIILDMPSVSHHVEKAATVLHVNGTLMAFNPSISQIMAVVDLIKRQYLPLQLGCVLELGPDMTGGREWDVRAVKPKADKMVGNGERSVPVDADDERTSDYDRKPGAVAEAIEDETRDHEEAEALGKQETGWRMICRPKVGHRVSGGGFLGVWKKMRW